MSSKTTKKGALKEKKASKQSTKHNQRKGQSQEESDGADIDFNQLQAQTTEMMEVAFIVAEIQECHYHSLKTILLRYAQITHTNNAELADAIIQNKQIGNVVLADDDEEDQDQEEQQEPEQGQDQQNDEENVYSVFSVFRGKSKLSKRLRSFVLKNIQKKDFPESITTILKEDTTGVIVNQRLANLPAFVVNSGLEVFKKEMDQLKRKDPTKYGEIFSGYLLNVSEVQFEGEEELEKLVYSKFEDYEMCKRAMVWWIGDKNQTYKKRADMRNLYYLIEGEEYLRGIHSIKGYLED